MREQNRRTRWFAFRRCTPIVIAIGIACGTIAVANVCGMAQEAEGVLVERIRFRDFSTARAIPGNVHVPSGASLLLTEMVNTQPRVFHMSLTNGAVFSCWQNSGDSREVPLPWMPGNSRESLFVDEDLSFGIVADDTRAVHREEGDHRVRGYTVSSVVADGVDGEFLNGRTIIARQIGETLFPEGDRRYILNSGDAFPSSFPPGVVVGVHNNTEGTLKLKTEVDGLGGVVSIAISLPAKTTLCFRTPREHAGLEASPFAGREWRAEDFYQDGIPLTYSFGAPGIWSGYADNPPRGGS